MTSVGPAGRGDGARAVLGALHDLRIALGEVRLPLDILGADEARAELGEVTHQLDDYIVPRYEQLEAPLLAVVGGSTGAGKSTLVNSLLGRVVSRPGVIRPTTRSPVLVHHPDDESWFLDERILPGLARVRVAPGAGPTPVGPPGAQELELRSSHRLPPGLALLDAPDIDSVVDENRALAHQLLAAADLWIFVTTAARYADAVPWKLLREAAERRIVIAVVLDRVPAGVGIEVRTDLAARLADEGLQRAPLFVISETTIGSDGLLPEADVAPLLAWMHGLASDAGSRAAVARQTLGGAVDSALDHALSVSAGVREQLQARARLSQIVDDAYAQAHTRIMAATEDGAMLRGEVLARWQEFVGTGEFFRTLEARVGRLRDRIGAMFRGRPAPTEPVEEAIETGLQTLLVAEVERATAQVDFAWRGERGTTGVLGDAVARRPADAAVAQDAARTVREWQGHLLDMVRDEGADKRFTARMLSFGVNGLAVALIIVIFASTGGLTGGEVAVAGGTAVVAQTLLEAVFGEDAVRKMTRSARQDLHDRSGALLARHAESWRGALSGLAIDPGVAERIDGVVASVGAARRAEVGR